MSYKGGKVIGADERSDGFVRTGYRCKANGCPNAGPIGETFGSDNSGVCYWHWIEPDPKNWNAVTQMILRDFARMRNFDEKAPPARPGTPREALAALKGLKIDANGLEWALTLREREQQGHRLTRFQKDAWRDALGAMEP